MSSLQDLQEQASKIPGPFGWILVILLAVLSWLVDVAEHGLTAWHRISIGLPGWHLYLPTFAEITPAGIAAGILAITGALVLAGGQISKLVIQHKKDMDVAMKESLSTKLDASNEHAERLRQNLDAFRSEAAARDARNQLEIERLHKEVLARDERHNTETERFLELLTVIQADNDRLRKELANLQKTAQRIEEKTDHMSGDNIPVHRPKHSDPKGEDDGSSYA